MQFRRGKVGFCYRTHATASISAPEGVHFCLREKVFAINGLPHFDGTPQVNKNWLVKGAVGSKDAAVAVGLRGWFQPSFAVTASANYNYAAQAVRWGSAGFGANCRKQEVGRSRFEPVHITTILGVLWDSKGPLEGQGRSIGGLEVLRARILSSTCLMMICSCLLIFDTAQRVPTTFAVICSVFC